MFQFLRERRQPLELLCIHVGAHKTASSLLQNSLQLNKSILQDAGLSYVHKYELVKRPFMLHVMQALDKDLDAGRVSRSDARSDFAKLVAKLSGPRILMSHENFLGFPQVKDSKRDRMYPDAERVLELLSELSEVPFRVLVYIRSQPSFLESIYLQRVKSGKVESFKSFIDQIDVGSVSWYRLIRSLEAIVGRDRLRVIPYETVSGGGRPYLDVMLRACDVEIDKELAISAEQNPSLSEPALKIALHAAGLLDLEGRKHLGRFLQQRFGSDKLPRPQLLDAERRAEIVRLFDAENRLLFETYIDPSLHKQQVMKTYRRAATEKPAHKVGATV